jgi:hypothetical protein
MKSPQNGPGENELSIYVGYLQTRFGEIASQPGSPLLLLTTNGKLEEALSEPL